MLLLEPTFPSTASIEFSSHTDTHAASGGTLDSGIDLSVLTGCEAKNAQLVVPVAVSEAELNDYNITQLQLQYESGSMDGSLNTMHSLTSIDLLHDHPHHHSHLDPEQDLDNTDPDYDGRRMSSSAISSASAQSTHSVHTSSTAATSHSGFSAQHAHSLKRAPSPSMMDEFDSYDAFDNSPRAKRARPSLNLEPGSIRMGSASPAPTNTTASAGASSGNGNGGNGNSRVQLPPLFSALENTSSSAPPTSHGTQTPFAQTGGNQLQQSYSETQGQGQSQTLSQSAFPTSHFAFNVTGTGLDLRRGSLPSLYSNSLAARYAQRVPSQGPSAQNQTGGGSRFAFNNSSGGMGLSPGPSPLSSLSAPGGAANDATSGLAGYQFPAPSGSDSGNGSNGSGSTPTPTPNTSTSAPGASPFGSGMTPLSSAPSSGFPQTPLEFAQQQNSSNYQNAYGQQPNQNQNQKDYDRFAKEYLNTGNEWGSIARPSSTPSAANTPASANPSGAFGFTNPSSGLGGLPRISGHSKNTDAQHQQEWFSPTGQLVLPSPSTNTATSTSSSRHQQSQSQPQTASLSPSPRMHTSTSAASSTSASATAAAAAAAAAALNVSPVAAAQAAQVAAQVAARPARRRGKLPKPTTDFLKDWLHRHSDHPYPSEEEKKQLCHATGLSMSQVSNWMINARRRILAPAQRNQQGPTTTVPSFPLGTTHSSNMTRTPLGLSPAGPLSSTHPHLSHSQSSYGLGMGSGMSGIGLGLIGSNGLGGGMSGMSGGMGYQQTGGHQLHTTQGLSGSGGGMYAQQPYRQQHQGGLGHGHSALYDIGHLHAQRRASMPALALHSHLSNTSPLGSVGGNLQLYPSTTPSRNSLPGPSPLPQVGYTSAYSPQPGSGPGQMGGPMGSLGTPPAPTPQRGYVFPPPSVGGSNNGNEDR